VKHAKRELGCYKGAAGGDKKVATRWRRRRRRCGSVSKKRLNSKKKREEDRQARRHKKGPRRGRGPVYSVKFNEPNQLYATRSLAKKVLFQVSWPHSFFHFNGNAKNNKNKQQE